MTFCIVIENAIVKVVALKIGHVPIPERGENAEAEEVPNIVKALLLYPSTPEKSGAPVLL